MSNKNFENSIKNYDDLEKAINTFVGSVDNMKKELAHDKTHIKNLEGIVNNWNDIADKIMPYIETLQKDKQKVFTYDDMVKSWCGGLVAGDYGKPNFEQWIEKYIKDGNIEIPYCFREGQICIYDDFGGFIKCVYCGKPENKLRVG